VLRTQTGLFYGDPVGKNRDIFALRKPGWWRAGDGATVRGQNSSNSGPNRPQNRPLAADGAEIGGVLRAARR